MIQKNKLHFTIGLFIGVIMSIALYFGYKQLFPGLIELYAILFCLIVGLIFWFIILKRKTSRIGLIIGVIPIIGFIISSIIKELPSKEVREFSKQYLTSHTNYLEKYANREKTMNDSTLSLLEKLHHIKFALNGVSELANVTFKIVGEDSIKMNRELERKYKSYYNNFLLNPSSLDLRHRNIKIHHTADTIGIKFDSGDSTIIAINSEDDQYIGYLDHQKVYIFKDYSSENGSEYFSLNRYNGEKLNGIPLIGNADSTIYADVHFATSEGKLDLVIAMWAKLDNSYTNLFKDHIPMGFFKPEIKVLPFTIDYIYWDHSILNFDLQANNSKGKHETVQFEIKVELSD